MERVKRQVVDNISKNIFRAITIACSLVSVFIIVFITVKGLSPFIQRYQIGGQDYSVNFVKFIFGNTWYISPNIYSIGFVIVNTIYVVFLSCIISVPISVLTALFIVKMAPKRLGAIMGYAVELLAAIPSIIFGVFGMNVITKFVSGLASIFGIATAGGISTLATVLVLAIMIMPTVTLLSITSIKAVKREQELGSLALGASVMQTNFKIVLRGAKRGIFAGIILGIGRALGEATAISMVCGNSGKGISFNVFDTTRTLTTTMMLGLKETEGLDYDIRFSVGIVLMIIIIAVNVGLNLVKRKMK